MARLKPGAPRWWARDHLTRSALRAALAAALQPALARAHAAARPGLPLVLDVGCGHKPYADLLAGTWHVGLNLESRDASADVCADAACLPLPASCAHLVLCSQLLEHVPEPAAVLAEVGRVLVPGAALVLSAPFFWPLHEEPHDYQRFTRHGLERLLTQAGFAEVTVRPDCRSLTQAAVTLIECSGPAARALAPLLNLLVPPLQRLSRQDHAPLNWIAVATWPGRDA